jgi:hypothetical protein
MAPLANPAGAPGTMYNYSIVGIVVVGTSQTYSMENHPQNVALEAPTLKFLPWSITCFRNSASTAVLAMAQIHERLPCPYQ